MDEKKELKIQCYCMNLRHASNVLTKYYDQKMAPLQITANQFFLLHVVYFLKRCNKSEIARVTRLERTTIVRNLDILLKKNLMEQVPGPTKRNQLVQLTSSGEKTWKRGMDIWEKIQAEMEILFGEEHLEALSHLLSCIKTLEESLGR